MPAGEEVDHGEPMANKRRTHPTAERARSHLEKCLARRERLAVQGPPGPGFRVVLFQEP